MSAPNFLFLSPHFPAQMSYFAVGLARSGFRVLGVADEHFDCLPEHVRKCLTEYYRVDNLENYEEIYRATAYFVHKYGRIQFVESLNEHWLETEARLREDFNITGIPGHAVTSYRLSELRQKRKKSGMKDLFLKAGVPVPQWTLPKVKADLIQFAQKVGFPVFAKPDTGVGAQGTYLIEDAAALDRFYSTHSDKMALGKVIVEEFVNAEIVTFDGLTNGLGDIVFASSMEYSDPPYKLINGAVNHCTFWLNKEIDPKVADAGHAVVKAFGFKRHFFHIEFFRFPDGKIMGLEVNLRTPGAHCVDCWNYANDMDIYALYGTILLGTDDQRIEKIDRMAGKALFAVASSGRHTSDPHKHSPQEIERELGLALVSHSHLPPAFAVIMGDDVYIFRCETMAQVTKYIKYVVEQLKH